MVFAQLLCDLVLRRFYFLQAEDVDAVQLQPFLQAAKGGAGRKEVGLCGR